MWFHKFNSNMFNVIPMTITNISSALFSLVLYNYKFTNERNIETSV